LLEKPEEWLFKKRYQKRGKIEEKVKNLFLKMALNMTYNRFLHFFVKKICAPIAGSPPPPWGPSAGQNIRILMFLWKNEVIPLNLRVGAQKLPNRIG
jgi:hypothetical protein